MNNNGSKFSPMQYRLRYERDKGDFFEIMDNDGNLRTIKEPKNTSAIEAIKADLERQGYTRFLTDIEASFQAVKGNDKAIRAFIENGLQLKC